MALAGCEWFGQTNPLRNVRKWPPKQDIAIFFHSKHHGSGTSKSDDIFLERSFCFGTRKVAPYFSRTEPPFLSPSLVSVFK